MPQSSIFPDFGESPNRNPVTTDDSAVAKQASIECNISKLLELPWEQCPWPAVRSRMLRLAIEGAEIYAYRPAFSKRWVIWYPLEHQPHSKYSPREWAHLHGYAIDEQEGGDAK